LQDVLDAILGLKGQMDKKFETMDKKFETMILETRKELKSDIAGVKKELKEDIKQETFSLKEDIKNSDIKNRLVIEDVGVQLRGKMDEGFKEADQRFTAVDVSLNALQNGQIKIQKTSDDIKAKLSEHEIEFRTIDNRLGRIENIKEGVDNLKERSSKLEINLSNKITEVQTNLTSFYRKRYDKDVEGLKEDVLRISENIEELKELLKNKMDQKAYIKDYNQIVEKIGMMEKEIVKIKRELKMAV